MFLLDVSETQDRLTRYIGKPAGMQELYDSVSKTDVYMMVHEDA
jgi:hypothetical protein